MVKCSYPLCPDDSSDKKLTFFRFPCKRKNKQIWEAWLSILSQAKRREIVNSRTCSEMICSKHFVEADLKHRRRGPPILLPTAIPLCPTERSVSFCDLEKENCSEKSAQRKQGTLLRFVVDKKPTASIRKPLKISKFKGTFLVGMIV